MINTSIQEDCKKSPDAPYQRIDDVVNSNESVERSKGRWGSDTEEMDCPDDGPCCVLSDLFCCCFVLG